MAFLEKKQGIHRTVKRTTALVTAIGCMMLTCCGVNGSVLRQEDFAMGTTVNLTLYGDSVQTAADAIFSEIHHLDALLSWRTQTSQTAAVNQHAGEEALVDAPELAQLLEEVLPVCQQSGGRFNPAIGALSVLWDIGGEHPRVPEQAELDAALKLIDWQDIVVQNQQVGLRKAGQRLDLGAVGKGAACDAAKQLMVEQGIEAGVVAVGGSVVTYGTKPDGTDWQIVVRSPVDSAASAGTLSLSGTHHISTSGDYERYFEQDGIRYHHLLDPATGMPGDSEVCSVTIVHESGAIADALSTAVFLLGKEKGLSVMKQFQAEGILIDRSQGVTVTDGLRERFALSTGFTLVDQ